MTARTWQMAAALVSVAMMVVVLIKYGLGGHTPPSKQGTGQPHVGAQHHGAEVTSTGSQAAPLQAFANAKVGDWIAYRVLNRSTLLPKEIEAFVVARVTSATESTVTVTYKGNASALPERRDEWKTEYPREGLTFDQLTGNNVSEWTIFDLNITDDVHEVGGRSFKCKKLSWSAKDPLFPNKRVREEMWVSDEVPVEGLVEERDVQDLGDTHMEQLKELVGFGTADATTWGTKPTDHP